MTNALNAASNSTCKEVAMKDTFKLIEEKVRDSLKKGKPDAHRDDLLYEIIEICMTAQRVITECE